MKLELLKNSKFDAFKENELVNMHSLKGGVDEGKGDTFTARTVNTYVGANGYHYWCGNDAEGNTNCGDKWDDGFGLSVSEG